MYFFMRTGFWGFGGTWYAVNLSWSLGSLVRFLLSRATWKSTLWNDRVEKKVMSAAPKETSSHLCPSKQEAKAPDLPPSVFFWGYKGWRAFMQLVLLLIAFRLEKRTLSFCHCCNLRGVGVCGSLHCPVSGWATPAVLNWLQDSCWVLPSPSSSEAMGLGDIACHFSLLPLQGRHCLTLVVYTAPSTMSATHIN